jgi:hypothetical protein
MFLAILLSNPKARFKTLLVKKPGKTFTVLPGFLLAQRDYS